METIIKLELEYFFSPIICPEKLSFFQLSQNSSKCFETNDHPPPAVVFIQRIFTLLFTYAINPETYGIAIRRRKKRKREGKKRRKEWNERGLIYVSASSRSVPRSGDVERVHVIRQLFIILLVAYDRRETRQFMRVLIFSLSFYFLFFSLPISFLPLLFVNWHRQDIRLGEAE